jgi:aminoglycoside phosphotransferase (APT) family kinase protein
VNLELLPDLIRHVFGSQTTLERYEIANNRTDYVVLLADLLPSPQRVVIKLAGPRAQYPCPFDRTAAIHRLVRGLTTVPMQEVLAVDTSYRYWPWRYMIQSYALGLEWADALPQMDTQEQGSAYRQIGHAVAGLHTIPFPAFGDLGESGATNPGSSYLERLAKRAKQRIKDPDKTNLFLNLLQERAALFMDVTQPSLCHDDLHKHNILFQQEGSEWHLSAILDFDSAYAGHHESDLSRLDLWRGMIGPGFWEAYTEVLLLSPSYEQRRPIQQLLWCLEYEADTPEHREDTRRVYDEVMRGDIA